MPTPSPRRGPRTGKTKASGISTAAPLSPEVKWYLKARGIKVERWQKPLWRTPEPRDVAGAVFDPARVDWVISRLKTMRHSQGKWAGRPLNPDPWQIAFVIAPVFGWVRWDEDAGKFVRIIRTMWVEVPRKNGKGIAVDEEILTAEGWKRFGDLRVGDLVHAEDGTLVPVSFVSEDHHLDCYRVTFGDGRSVVCDADHLWTVWDRYGHDPEAWKCDHSKGAWVTIDTPALFANQRCGSRGDTRYSVHTDRVIHRPDVELPIDPYVLGYWLGDWTSASAQFTVDDDDYPNFVRMVEAAGYQVWVSHRNGEHSVTAGVTTSARKRDANDSLQKRLRDLGVLGDKHVPDSFLLAGDDQRLALLRGLMDSDGTCIGKNGHAPRCEFTATNRRLADAVLFLARSLGWRATIGEGRATIDGRDCGPKWRVSWSAKASRSPFALQRKSARLSADLGRTRADTATIVKVERVDSVTTRCIQVEHPSHQFLVGRGLIPTHNTTIAAGLGLYLAFFDGEPGAQVIAAAGSKDQAMNAYRPAMLIAEKSPAMKGGGVRPLKREIVRDADQSFMRAVGSVGDLLQGSNPSGAIVDELHVHKDSSVIDALESGQGARDQPLTIIITTANDGDKNSVYAVRRKHIENLCRGAGHSPSEYGVIFAAPESADPFKEATWKRANPGYGVTPTKAFMESEAAKAKESPAQRARFYRLNLNRATPQETRYIDMRVWDQNRGRTTRIDMMGRPCFGGVDLASTSDLSALCLLFPREDWGFTALWRFWTPEDNIPALDSRTNGAASRWVEDGWLTTTPGNVQDYDYIRSDLNDLSETYDIQSVGFDPYNATQLVNDLTADGIQMVKVRQGFMTLSAPTKEMQRLLLRGSKAKGHPGIEHLGNPVMRWCVDNLGVEIDAAGNIKPSKKKSGDKIDGVAALVNALAEATAQEQLISAYNDHALITI